MNKSLRGYGLVVVLLVLVLALGVAVGRKLSVEAVQAAPPSSTTSGVAYTCTPSWVVAANVRVVVRCSVGYVVNPSTTIIWFAYPTSDSGNASRILSVFESAKATGSTVTVYFDTADLSGSAYGCLNADCRAIWAVTTP